MSSRCHSSDGFVDCSAWGWDPVLWLAGGLRETGTGLCSGLAPDVELVGLEDEIGASLAVSDESPKQRRTQVANPVHAPSDVWCRHSGEQVIDLTTDQHVFVGKAGYGVGQPRRGLEEIAIEPVGTFCDVDVLTKVAGELHQRSVDAFGPTHSIGCGWRGQGILQRAHRLAQLRAVSPELLQEGPVRCGRVRFHRPSVRRITLGHQCRAFPVSWRTMDALHVRHRYRGDVEGTFMETIALGALGENLLAEARSASSGRCAVTIHGGHVNSLRQTAIGLAAGHALDEHENTGEITLQMIRGRARVVAASGDAQLVAGDYVIVPQEWDSFEALEDTVVLLTASVQGSPD